MIRSLSLLGLGLAAALSAQVKITSHGPSQVAVEIDGKPFTTLFTGPETTKPYLHPLRSASGVIVTRMYPMEKKQGDSTDHIHQRGLWFTHGDVNGLDFWANDPTQQGPKKGRVQLKKLGELKSGKKTGSISATFDWVDADGKLLLTEDRTMTFHADPKLRIVDFDVTFTGVEKSHFGDTKEGFFAIRLAEELIGKRNGKMVNAAGKAGEKEVWGKASPWVDYSGQVEGQPLGIAIFDHPSNPKHPTYWHSRDYGLFAANAFGEHDFFNDKSRDGGMTLAPGQKWRFRYRVIIHPGLTADAGLQAAYNIFSKSK
ncbi:MAG: PmoA family protein [Acidobacteriia bacterium]|nr:PmoA family protein [Terriglobia bacterium]